MKRFIFTLPMEVYLKMRKVAFKKNISMSMYVQQALLYMLEKEVD